MCIYKEILLKMLLKNVIPSETLTNMTKFFILTIYLGYPSWIIQKESFIQLIWNYKFALMEAYSTVC